MSDREGRTEGIEGPGVAPASASVDPATAARIAASVDAWKRKLLDLTKRNRALNFRVNKVSTVTIVDELPAEVFRHLYLRERSMRFKAAPEEAEPTPASQVSDIGATALAPPLPAEVAEDDAPQPEFVPYDAASLDERHTDEWLQTTSTPDALDKSLRRLDEQARLAIDEQGVNTLFLALGMLHYLESPDSQQVFRAPLVLLPVELTRKTARMGYVVRAGDDDPMVNPALVEYLRRQHSIAVPELPDSSAIPEDYDLQGLFAAVSAAVAERPGWSVKASVHLALFSFQKLVMYKDLEANAPALAVHRLVRQLVTRKGDERGGAVVGLPDEIRAMDLDRDFPPEGTWQVVDADSSQLRAVAAVSRNHDLVIEGPPGTGKSQTITNLIAQALAAGKSVLFVAEKMAALSVVHDRLVRAGLGEFCLELHSTKANKRAVMRELAAALDASVQRVAAPSDAVQKLPQARVSLTEYVQAVHAVVGPLGASPWRAYGELSAVTDAPRVRYAGPASDGVPPERLEQTLRELRDLAAASQEIGVPAQHPWRDTTKTFYSTEDLESVEEVATDLLGRLDDVARRAAAVADSLSLPALRTFTDTDTAASIAGVLAKSPGAPLAVLESAAWNAPPADATALIERGRALHALEARVLLRITDAALEQEHAEDIAHVERKAGGMLGFLAFLDGRYRAIRRRWKTYRQPSFTGSMLDQSNDMRQVDRIRAERNALDAARASAQALFGDLWNGWRSDWDALDAYVRWVVTVRELCVRHGLRDKALAVASRKEPDLSEVRALGAAVAAAREQLARLRDLVGWPADHLAAEPFPTIVERVRGLRDHVALAPRWAGFEATRQAVEASLATEILPAVMDGTLPFAQAEPAFRRAFWTRWLTEVVRARPVLERFHTLTHEQRVTEFRELDRRVLVENRARLVGELRERVQGKLREPAAADAMPHLRREMARQRGLSPLRKTLRIAEPAVLAIKPCLMMSPLTVAQLLDGATPKFDLVLFDEASQLPPEDAVGAVFRARQLVVVGDPKQLPPTNFFAVTSGTVEAPLGDDGEPLFEDTESILEDFTGAGFPTCRLRWHYRSAHESLINFSNVQFYDADLSTFPSVERGTDAHGLQFEYVADGIYEGKGLNAVEARRVADEVVQFAREQLARRAAGEPTQSLGVGTFNLRQQLAIQDELEPRRRDDPSLEPFFDRTTVEPFFIKNLENIQGDERDVIFLSVTYARAADGRLRYNFGPLNGENGWRRLNVLTTRARHRMRVFSSMRGDDISAADTTARGAHLLRDFLLYAERGRLESSAVSLAADTESPFEREVLRELQDHGITVVPQVGTAGYRVDLGVVDAAAPGRFVCGIECDGVAYHASETARDRDRLRQQVLEARGWTIHRVWSTDWFKDRAGQVERLVRLVGEDRRRALDHVETERIACERALREAALRQAEDAASAQLAASALMSTPDLPYERPVAQPYAMAPGAGRHSRGDLLTTPFSRVVHAVVSVVEAESPVHVVDVTTRVAGMWNTRAGPRVHAWIDEACGAAQRDGLVERRGDFLWRNGGAVAVRVRAGTRIPADRVAPEEYTEAILSVLRGGHGFSRVQLSSEVRTVFGFARTGAALDEAIGSAIEQLLAAGRLGEASAGICLRR